MNNYEKKLNSNINIKFIDENLCCIYGNEESSNYFIEIDKLIKTISKNLYNDEWFIEKSILSYKAQQEKTYTFYKNNSEKEFISKYNWCERPADTNMSLCNFNKNADVCCWMSESLAKKHGLEQITLNEFIFNFVQPIIKENIKIKGNNNEK